MPEWTQMLGLLGLIGLGGLVNMKWPVNKDRPGQAIRHMGILGLGGLAGIWVPPLGAMGAAGSLGLWNHQNRKLALWGALGWLWLVGLLMLAWWLLV